MTEYIVENIDALWEKYKQTEDVSLRNDIVVHYISFVKKVVYRMLPSYSKYVDFDDLMSAGVIGLINAVTRFDIKKGASFETYAYHRIKGEIIDYLRKQDFISVNLRHKIKEVEKAYSEIEAKEGRTAKDEEVCSYLNIDMKELGKILEDSHIYNIAYLDEILISNASYEPETDNVRDLPAQSYNKKETLNILKDCIESLSEKERMVITLYYYEEMTLKEIGLVLDVSESRVSQIHTKTIFKLKNKFDEQH